jgi:hypothetical protein
VMTVLLGGQHCSKTLDYYTMIPCNNIMFLCPNVVVGEHSMVDA